MLYRELVLTALALAMGGMFGTKPHRVAFVCGPQVSDLQELAKAREGLYRELRERTDLTQIIFMGDLVTDNADLLAPTVATFDSLPCPWFCVPGDRDRDFYRPATSLRPGKALPFRARDFATYRKVVGCEDTTWTAAGTRWIILNNIRTLSREQIRTMSDTSLLVDNDYVGGLNEHQKTWLAGILRDTPEKQAVILCTHIPLNRCAGADSLGQILALHPGIWQISSATASRQGGIYILERKSGRWMDSPLR